MAKKTSQISSLIESQLPGFITSEYEQFGKFVEKYYEHLESQGNSLDIIQNIETYRDINFYEKNLLNQKTKLQNSISNSSTTIVVEDTSSFPRTNGYIRIGDEICFYKERTDTEFLEVSRGVSGNITLGDLYDSNEFVTTEAENHSAGDEVYNISNLFLYAFVKNFEAEYLDSFPEKYLKGEIDKRTLIKNISDFYRAKGTDRSIKFIFNSIVSKSSDDIPQTYNPKDFTLKASTSDWINTYSLKVKILSGNPEDLIGNQITQALDADKPELKYASAFVDNVFFLGSVNGEDLYQIVLDPSSVNGNFEIPSKTTLTEGMTSLVGENDRINVISTMGMRRKGRLLIGNEVLRYKSKTVNQFVIENRGNPPSSHLEGTTVYGYSDIKCNGVKLLPLGVLYNLNVKTAAPYSEETDVVQVLDSGFETKNPIIYDTRTNSVRWRINESNVSPSVPLNSQIQSAINQLNADVSAIYEDDQYYYICSSSYPSYEILTSTITTIPEDGRILRLIRKSPITTTELYKTNNRDIGIFVDGTLAFSHKDTETVEFGKITKIDVVRNGGGYQKAPFVLINNQPNKARAILAGDVVESIEVLTDETFEAVPNVTITAGRNAEVRAVVTGGKITSLIIEDAGEYYSASPLVRITDLAGKGKFAEYKAIVSTQGQLVDFIKIDEGKFYTQENVTVEIIEDGRSRTAIARSSIEKWTYNRFEKLKNICDDTYGYLFNTYESLQNNTNSYIYGLIANPKRLRAAISDNLSNTFTEPSQKIHSPIIGFAYDGNPIYGPFGYSDPNDSESSIVRLASGYSLKPSRLNGPSTSTYPLGTFVEDYRWIASVNSGKTILDENNGRFCVTPDYPNGTYAYFITIDSNNTPIFPYILGENYYSLPIASNYDSNISQDELPLNSTRLKTANLENNGVGVYAYINSITSGSVSSVTIEDSVDNFEVGSKIYFNNAGTDGKEVSAIVSSVVGKNVVSLESKQTKAIELKTSELCYYFKDDIIAQENTGAYGELIGDVFNGNQLVLRNVIGTFNTTDEIFSTIDVINLVLSQNSSFTKDSLIYLSDGVSAPVAVGIILETTNRQNTVKIRVNSGNFVISDDLFLRSNNLIDTVGSQIIDINSLSNNISVDLINNNIAIVETDESHGLTKGDIVDIKINPDDNETETTYYVRKRYYQKLTLAEKQINAKIDDTGIGRFDYANLGQDYQTGTYTDVELIFQDTSDLDRDNLGYPGAPNNAKATITVSNNLGSGYGNVVNVVITDKGKGYKKGDVLTVLDEDLNRLGSSISTSRLTIIVDHAGVSKQNTEIKLTTVNLISEDDTLSIGREIVKVVSVNELEKTVIVERGFNSTTPADHYNGATVSIKDFKYEFVHGQRIIGSDVNDPYVYSYDKETQELLLYYDYISGAPRKVLISTSFYDSSNPQKLVKLSSVNDIEYRLEFSLDNINFDVNPVIQIQKYYKYIFDTSHFSMNGVYLDFSSSQNYNIVTTEKFVSQNAPGTPGSFISIKLGFGANIASNQYQNFVSTNFINYYYFVKGEYTVNTEKSYLKVIDDPLVGEKEVIYSTQTKFVYELGTIPQYDGFGEITYTTNSNFAVGKINSIFIQNTGKDYKKVPIIDGVGVANENKAIAEITYNSQLKNISSVNVLDGGNNYSKPKLLITNGDGIGAKFDIKVINGKIIKIDVLNKGKNYSYPPEFEIIETDVKLYANSNNIGIPKTISIINNGGSFHNDNTLKRTFKSYSTLLLKNVVDDAFSVGEKIVQIKNNIVVCSFNVTKNGWRVGSNILKVEKINGVIDPSLPIKGTAKNSTAEIVSILSTEFEPIIKTYFDNQGSYLSDKGKIGSALQKLTDSNFYQDYSYVIKSKTPIDIWRDLIKQTTHPAGFKVFGEVIIESDGSAVMPIKNDNEVTETIRFVDLGAKSVSVIDTQRTITETILNFDDLNVERGIGSIAVDTVDNTETIAGEIILASDFNGAFDPFTGQIIGNTTFVMIDKQSNLPINPFNEQQLIVTIDGILQEPGVSYTISGSQITFSSPPFGERLVDGQVVEAQSFYCKYFKFKNNDLNERYLKKVKSVSALFDGIQTTFDLYYEDDSIVKTDENENLIVTLNAVLQKAKNQEDEPFRNSYKIIRSEDPFITDKIEFTDPPISHQDLYNEEEQLSEKSFIYGVGSYLKLGIKTDLIPIKSAGPYLMYDEENGRLIKVDDSDFVLVFVDGVLQKENESYIINGSTITFSRPLNYYISQGGDYIYQDVYIILLYGRNVDQILTAFDFEPDTYYNKTNIRLEGSSDYQLFLTWLAQQPENSPSFSNDIWVYQGTRCLGTFVTYSSITEEIWEITLLSQNTFYDENLPLGFSRYSTLNDSSDLVLNNVLFLDLSYKVDTEDNQIYTKFINEGYRYLTEQQWFDRTKIYANLHPGDIIKIDGESEYREVVSVPLVVNTKDYRNNASTTNSIYGKVRATNYNGITRGEGLNVVASIEDGKVVNLDWNKRELELYYEYGILLQPNEYQYYTSPELNFIPLDGNGGGAKAQVLVSGGYVVDIVLVDGGSGYTTPPKIVVSRRFDKIKKNDRKAASIINLGLIPVDNEDEEKRSLYVKLEALISNILITDIGRSIDVASTTSGITFGSFSDVNLGIQITSVVNSEENASFEKESFPYELTAIIGVDYPVTMEESTFREVVNIISTPFDVVSSSSIQKVENNITKQISFTIDNKFVKKLYDTINDVGAYLEIPMSETDTVVYIKNTSKFPYSSRLLIGKEIVTYEKKLNDRFLEVTRGTYGTLATTHEAGDYLRHLPELVSIVPVGPEVSIVSEVKITDVHQTSSSFKQVISLSQNIESRFLSSIEIDRDGSVRRFYVFGSIDYLEEPIVYDKNILTREESVVVLEEPIKEVLLRDETTVLVRNTSDVLEYFNEFEFGNAGFNIKIFENNVFIEEKGDYDIVTLQQVERYSPSLTIGDFEERASCSIIGSGDIFNLTLSSIRTPVNMVSDSIDLDETQIIPVSKLNEFFSNTGKLFITLDGEYSLVSYTGKTTNSFTGCTLLSGSEIILEGSEIVPYFD